jgi:hypothetical protein
MEKSPSSEFNSHSESHEISRLLTEPKFSLLCSQGSATGPYPELDASSSHYPTLHPWDQF